MSSLINLNGALPAAASGFQLALWQKSSTSSGSDPTTGAPYFDASAEVPNTGGVNVQTANYTLQASDCGTFIVANSASPITFTLPASIPFDQWQVTIANIGAGALTVAPGGVLDLDGSTSPITIAQFASVGIATDGSNYFSARGSGGGGPAFVDSETVAGSGTSWTLAQTPAAGCVPIIKVMIPGYGGVDLLLGQTPGFTITGSAVTTTNSYSAGQIFAWYRY